jgi:hypothetical protein
LSAAVPPPTTPPLDNSQRSDRQRQLNAQLAGMDQELHTLRGLIEALVLIGNRNADEDVAPYAVFAVAQAAESALATVSEQWQAAFDLS